MPKTFTVNNDFHGTRLDRWFKKEVLDLPHSLIEKIIRQNKIKINNKKIRFSGIDAPESFFFWKKTIVCFE